MYCSEQNIDVKDRVCFLIDGLSGEGGDVGRGAGALAAQQDGRLRHVNLNEWLYRWLW